jgi:tetratricopeptide (TPR) repeat protein
LAAASFRLGLADHSLAVVERWLSKRPPTQHLWRGHFAAIALAAYLRDDNRYESFIENARNAGCLPKILAEAMPQSQLDAPIMTHQATTAMTLSPGQLAELAKIVSPRKPTKSATLAASLTRAQLAEFDMFVEQLSDGNYEAAIETIRKITTERPDLKDLRAAEGIAVLFSGDANLATQLLRVALKELGNSGNLLWNLAVAHVMLGNTTEAFNALQDCRKTEYKTSPSIPKALKLLKPEDQRSQAVQPIPSAASRITRPAPVQGILDLCQPRKLKLQYFPDRVRYRSDEREIIQRAIEATRELDPADAARVLKTHLETYPDCAALYAHLTSCLALSKNEQYWQEAKSYMEQAFRLPGNERPVAEVVINYLYFCASLEDTDDLIAFLSPIIQSYGNNATLLASLALAHSHVGSKQEASTLATASIKSATKHDANRIRELFRKASITPNKSTSVSTPLLAAPIAFELIKQAIDLLIAGDGAKAAEPLLSAWSEDLPSFPELSPALTEPKLEVVISADSDRRSDAALSLYLKGDYHRGASAFRSLFAETGRIRFATNSIACLLKANELDEGERLISNSFIRKWRARYNIALIKIALGKTLQAVRMLNTRLPARPDSRLGGILFDYCRLTLWIARREIDPSRYAAEVYSAALKLTQAGEPSLGLQCALAWAEIVSRPQNAPLVLDRLKKLVEVKAKPQSNELVAVSTLGEFNAAIEGFRRRRASSALLEFSRRVADASKLTGAYPLVFAAYAEMARECVVVGRHEEVLSVLSEVEFSLLEVSERESVPGLRTIHYLNAALLALECGALGLAERLRRSLVELDSGNRNVQEMAARIDAALEKHSDLHEQALRHLVAELRVLADDRNNAGAATTGAPDQIGYSSIQPSLPKWALVDAAFERFRRARRGTDEFSEAIDDCKVALKLICPDAFSQSAMALLSMVDARSPADRFDAYLDAALHKDEMWIVEHEGSARGTLSVKANNSLGGVLIVDGTTNEKVFDGNLGVGQEIPIRWTTTISSAGEDAPLIELPLLVGAAGSDRRSPLIITCRLNSHSPRVILPRSGALLPGDVEELYGIQDQLFGREKIVKELLENLGSTRSSHSYFIQGLRQMGKTSILRFVEDQSPNQVLSVYVNLEFPWGKGRRDQTFWAYTGRQIRQALKERRGDPGELSAPLPANFDEFVEFLDDLLTRNNRRYAHLLFDEFRYALELAEDPSEVLAGLRAVHNDPRRYKMAFTVADRKSRDELAFEVSHDIWAHFEPLNIGPLNEDAVRRALLVQNSDLVFSAEAVKRLHLVTGGYPYHIVRAVGNVARRLTVEDGPWLLVVGEDIEKVEAEILSDDRMFSEGLCPEARVSEDVFRALNVLLRASDLRDDAQVVVSANAGNNDFEGIGSTEALAHHAAFINYRAFIPLVASDDVVARMTSYGMLRRRNEEIEFFSPLFMKWLKKLRSEGRNPARPSEKRDWTLVPTGAIPKDVADWRNLDHSLHVAFAKSTEGRPLAVCQPLSADVWAALSEPVGSSRQFAAFIDAANRIFIENRAQSAALRYHPFLHLVLNEIRLLGLVLSGNPGTSNLPGAIWNRTHERALNRTQISIEQLGSSDWRRLQLIMQSDLSVALRQVVESKRG